jgi:NAD(P)H-hydrate epimerase
MSRGLSTKVIREFDRHAIEDLGFPGAVLMENAGRALAGEILRVLPGAPDAPVLVLCGTGNNGGDGYVAARHLAVHGIAVAVVKTGDPKPGGDAAVNLALARAVGCPVRDLADLAEGELADTLGRAPVAVDALLGTGLTGAPREPYAAIIRTVNARARLVVAADTPSGLNADTGEVTGEAVRAARTVTFAAPKTGFFRDRGPEHVGTLVTAHIGLPGPGGEPAGGGR